MVYLQQDAFDKVDVTVSAERQKKMFLLCQRLLDRHYDFANKSRVSDYFTNLTGLFKNLNYSPTDSDDYQRYLSAIDKLETETVAGI